MTEKANGGLIAHGVYEIDGVVHARTTAYADSQHELNDLLEAVEASELTEMTQQVTDFSNPVAGFDVAGNTTTELIVRYESEHSIHDAFVSRGFIPDRGIRVHDGNEYWTVIAGGSRRMIQQRIAEIERVMDARISVESIRTQRLPEDTFTTTNDDVNGIESLSERQREMFELARRNGYYTWPREVSVSELAESTDVSKTTLLEHLRKAEAKILGPE